MDSLQALEQSEDLQDRLYFYRHIKNMSVDQIVFEIPYSRSSLFRKLAKMDKAIARIQEEQAGKAAPEGQKRPYKP